MKLSLRPTVLHVRVLADRGGGPDKTILHSIKHLKAAGYRAAIAYIHPPDHDGIQPILERARQRHAPVFTIPDRGALDVGTAFRLAQLCHDLEVRIWHAHDYKSEAIGLMLKGVLPMRLVSTLHGYVHADRKAQVLYEVGRQCLRGYHHVLVVSPDLADAARQAGVNDNHLTYVPNGIDHQANQRTQTTAQARQALGIDPNRKVIAVSARLSGEKRIDRAIALLYELQKKQIDAELHLAGDGPLRAELQDQAATLGVTDRVVFHGWLNQTAALLEAADLVLLPSDKEGLPNALLEAMARSTAVAATPVGGVPDLLDHGNAGRLLAGPVTNWIQPIANLLEDDNARQQLALAGRQRIENHFTFDQRMQKVIRIYDHLLDRKTRRAA
ncbi:glycosyltransferase family 4 protein [Mucisphaera sp.]|uniref:glycosyltransferase family 4 protein n=1 Tax=Mucisphaera sp. TaxID=2913024 RepID=UPI003D0BE3E2